MTSNRKNIQVRSAGGRIGRELWVIRSRLLGHLRTSLITGLLLLIPVAFTYVIVKFLFDLADGVLRPWISWILEQFGIDLSLPGPGIVAAVLLVYLTGVVFAYKLGRGILQWVQSSVLKIPFVGTIYSANRQLIESFSGTNATGFKRVVLAQFPKPNTWSIGFLTGIVEVEGVGKRLAVYVPTAPLPNSGFVVMLPPDEVLDTDLTVPEAMQLIFSGGLISPKSIKTSKVDMDEFEKQVELIHSPQSGFGVHFRETFTESLSKASRATRLPAKAIRESTVNALRLVLRSDMKSDKPAREAVIGAIHATRVEGTTSVKETVIGVIQGVKEAEQATENLIYNAVAGAIQGSKETGGNPVKACQEAAEGAVLASISVGMPIDVTILQITRGAMDAAEQLEIDIEDVAGATIKGLVEGINGIHGNVIQGSISAALELMERAAQSESDLGKFARKVLEGAIEAGGTSRGDAEKLAHSVASTMVEAAYNIDESTGERVADALTGNVGGMELTIRQAFGD